MILNKRKPKKKKSDKGKKHEDEVSSLDEDDVAKVGFGNANICYESSSEEYFDFEKQAVVYDSDYDSSEGGAKQSAPPPAAKAKPPPAQPKLEPTRKPSLIGNGITKILRTFSKTKKKEQNNTKLPVAPAPVFNIVDSLKKEGFAFPEEKREGTLNLLHPQQVNFVLVMVASIRKALKNFNNYCALCHTQHACERIEGKPVVCSNPLCLFRYGDLRVSSVLAECEVCPFKGCSKQETLEHNTEVIKALYPGPAPVISLKELVQMHKHRYLPSKQLREFVLKMGTGTIRAVTVVNILKADLVVRFEKKWDELRKKYPNTKVKPEIAWHGTMDRAIEGIKSKGLLLPGRGNAVGHASGNNGYYGDGIYLSPVASYSAGYMRGGRNGLFLCSVLMGKPYKLQNMAMGSLLTAGYDSHIDPTGNEYVLFDEGQVLPCYLISVGY